MSESMSIDVLEVLNDFKEKIRDAESKEALSNLTSDIIYERDPFSRMYIAIELRDDCVRLVPRWTGSSDYGGLSADINEVNKNSSLQEIKEYLEANLDYYADYQED